MPHRRSAWCGRHASAALPARLPARTLQQHSSTSAFAPSPPTPSLQVRDFIHDSLYNPRYGYFAAQAAPVGTLRAPIDFRRLQGHKHYLRTVQEVYQELQVGCFCDNFPSSTA